MGLLKKLVGVGGQKGRRSYKTKGLDTIIRPKSGGRFTDQKKSARRQKQKDPDIRGKKGGCQREGKKSLSST